MNNDERNQYYNVNNNFFLVYISKSISNNSLWNVNLLESLGILNPLTKQEIPQQQDRSNICQANEVWRCK